jgi:hypothetical protein
MFNADESAFGRFASARAADFRRIARASRGESSPDDVAQEAWILAADIGQRRGRPLDLDDPRDADLLVRCLHNECVKYTERVVRHAVRLDHAARGDEERGNHWLNDRLASDGGAHPLSLLEDAEAAAPDPVEPDAYQSPAAGWLRLLQRFDQRMADVAAFLMISASWCYTCCRHARHQAATQWPLPHGLSVGEDDSALRAWRTFKLDPRFAGECEGQLAFDYWSRPEQPGEGQLWLL